MKHGHLFEGERGTYQKGKRTLIRPENGYVSKFKWALVIIKKGHVSLLLWGVLKHCGGTGAPCPGSAAPDQY